MNDKIYVGDLVISLTGRDKGKLFLVVCVAENYVKIVDGKFHKLSKPKTKNYKHIKKVLSATFTDIAEKINQGQTVGNKRIYKLIMAEKKLQED